ncbi:hypothetical protein ACFVW8_32230 [Streptomyces sp. NPDC058221]|uniref:hypothetical protein n=1 Tax=Streptomyces sp. NPDC058221 TaxID=3346388 RepID=UPI0036E6BF87
MNELPPPTAAVPGPGTGWFLDLCGPLTVTGPTARANLRMPDAVPAHADRLIAAEALHQIACRLASQVRGAQRAVPAKVVELRGHPQPDGEDHWRSGGAVLEARVVRSGRLSTVEARLAHHGRNVYSASVCTQEVA